MADEVKFTDSTTDLSEGESNVTLGEKAWYVVNTYSTHENKVKENLRRRVESMGLEDLIFQTHRFDTTTEVFFYFVFVC